MADDDRCSCRRGRSGRCAGRARRSATRAARPRSGARRAPARNFSAPRRMRSTNSRMSSPPVRPAPALGRRPAAQLAVGLGGPLGRRAVPLRVADLLQPHVDVLGRGRARSSTGAAVWRARSSGDTRTSSNSWPAIAVGQRRGLAVAELGERRVDDVEPVAHPLRLGVTDQHQLHRTSVRLQCGSVSRLVSRSDGPLRVPLPQRRAAGPRRRRALRVTATTTTRWTADVRRRPALVDPRRRRRPAGRRQRRRHRRRWSAASSPSSSPGCRSSASSALAAAVVGLGLVDRRRCAARRPTGDRRGVRHRRHRHERARRRPRRARHRAHRRTSCRAIERFDDPGPERGRRSTSCTSRTAATSSPAARSRTSATTTRDVHRASSALGRRRRATGSRSTTSPAGDDGDVRRPRRRGADVGDGVVRVVEVNAARCRSASIPTSSTDERPLSGRPAAGRRLHPRRRRAGRTCRRRRRARRGGRPRRAGRRRARAPGRRGPRSTGGGRWRSSCGPRRGACRAREMRTSVSASTDDVASSSTSTSGSATPARSRATSWRSPADSCSPRSPTGVISPSGRLSTQSPRSRRSTTASMSASDVPGPGEADVGGDRVVEQERLLRHDDEARGAARRWRRRCSGTPPRRISPIVGSAKRAISRPSVVLPDPVAPTMRDLLAGRDVHA